MSTRPSNAGASRRRSQRVMLRLPVLVHGIASDGKPFHEHTYTLVVNAHGALILLAAKVPIRQKITLTNTATEAGAECRVVFLGAKEGDKAQVGVEFLAPNPKFWNIDFPPSDWHPQT